MWGLALVAAMLPRWGGGAARAQDMPLDLAVYGGACSVLIVDDKPSAKPCIGSLIINGFGGGQKTVMFHNTDDEVIAFHTVQRQGAHYAVTAIERNGQTDAASGTCTIDLTPAHTGEIRCEAKAGVHTTSGVFAVQALKHEIGAPER